MENVFRSQEKVPVLPGQNTEQFDQPLHDNTAEELNQAGFPTTPSQVDPEPEAIPPALAKVFSTPGEAIRVEEVFSSEGGRDEGRNSAKKGLDWLLQRMKGLHPEKEIVPINKENHGS